MSLFIGFPSTREHALTPVLSHGQQHELPLHDKVPPATGNCPTGYSTSVRTHPHSANVNAMSDQRAGML